MKFTKNIYFIFFSLPEINLSRKVKMVTMLKKFICCAASVTSGQYYLLLRIKLFFYYTVTCANSCNLKKNNVGLIYK